MVDRLNGQKTQNLVKENAKRCDKYYELYKNPKENALNSFLNRGRRGKKKIPHNFFFNYNSHNNSKIKNYGENSSYNTNKELSMNSNSNLNGRNSNNLNSRILALKEKITINSPNNSFRSDNKIDNYKMIRKRNDIVLPSNFSCHN